MNIPVRNLCFAFLFAAPFFGCGRQDSKQVQTPPKKQASSAASPTPPAAKSDTTLAFLEGEWETHEMRCDDCLRHSATVNFRMNIKKGVVRFIKEGKETTIDSVRYVRAKNCFLFTKNGMIKVNDANSFTYDTDVHFDGETYSFSRIAK